MIIENRGSNSEISKPKSHTGTVGQLHEVIQFIENIVGTVRRKALNPLLLSTVVTASGGCFIQDFIEDQ